MNGKVHGEIFFYADDISKDVGMARGRWTVETIVFVVVYQLEIFLFFGFVLLFMEFKNFIVKITHIYIMKSVSVIDTSITK